MVDLNAEAGFTGPSATYCGGRVMAVTCVLTNSTVIERTQEFRKNLAKIAQAVCGNLMLSATATDPREELTLAVVSHLGEIRQR
jgi:hypothetical protein